MGSYLIPLNTLIFEIGLPLYAVYAENQAGNNSGIVCPPFNSEIKNLMPIIQV